MSNIFEIDGEIEDNMDDNGDGKKSKKKKNQNKNLDSDQSQGNDLDSTQSGSESKAEQNQDSDQPWYNKYLPDDESENQQNEDSDVGGNDSDKEDVTEEYETESKDSENDEFESEIPKVEDITQEEIDEVLAEIDESEKELEAAELYSDSEDEIENTSDEEEPNEDEDYHEPFDEIFPRSNKKPVAMGTWIFMVLFLISLTLLSYYQFYDGKSFALTFEHKSHSGISQIDSLATKYQTQMSELKNQQKIITELREKIQGLNAQNIDLVQDTAAAANVLNTDGSPANTSINLMQGTYFQVQLIALKQYHPSFNDAEFSFYVDKEDGFSKMLIGAFSAEESAKSLYEKVRRAGFKDAFIVKKVNGSRVEYNPFD